MITSSYCQPFYDFDFSKNWEWGDLIASDAVIAQGLNTEVLAIQDEFDILEARILLLSLSKLDSINQIINIQEVAEKDTKSSAINFYNAFVPQQKYIDFTNNLSGLLKAAVFLANIRKNLNTDKISFNEEKFDINFIPNPNNTFLFNTDYSIAEDILDIFDTNYDDYEIINKLERNTAFTNIFKDSSEAKNVFFEQLLNAKKDSYIYKIYFVTNPSAFLSLGNVYVFRKNYSNALLTLKKNESDLISYISYMLSFIFKSEITLSNNIYLTYGTKQLGRRTSDNGIIFNLIPFANDFEKFAKYLTRDMLIDGRKAVEINFYDYIFSTQDSLYLKLFESIYEDGLSNFTAPVVSYNRPSTSVEKDFVHFRKLFKSIREKKDSRFIDSLIMVAEKEQFFSSMGSQMSFMIDVKLGRNSLQNSVYYGSLFFFKEYIRLYKNSDNGIRQIFRFSSEIENKVNELSYQISYEMLEDVINIKSKYIIRDSIIAETNKLFKKYKGSYNIWFLNLLTGKMMMQKGLYTESFEYIKSALPNILRKELFTFQIGNEYYRNGFYKEAIEMLTKNIFYSPQNIQGYLYRGLAYYESGLNDEAKQDFGKVLELDPMNQTAREYLEK